MTAILDVARTLLVDQGLARMTTNRIAGLAGVSVGSLYQYFPNKESIVTALGRRFEDATLERATRTYEALRARSVREITRALVAVLVRVEGEERNMRRSLLREVPRGWMDRTNATTDETVERWLTELIDERKSEVRRASPRTMAFVAYHALSSVVSAALVQRPELLDDDRFVDELARLTWSYLRREDAESRPA